MSVAYIHITPTRLELARQRGELVKDYFIYTSSSHDVCSVIRRMVHYRRNYTRYILLNGIRVDVEPGQSPSHYYIL